MCSFCTVVQNGKLSFISHGELGWWKQMLWEILRMVREL